MSYKLLIPGLQGDLIDNQVFWERLFLNNNEEYTRYFCYNCSNTNNDLGHLDLPYNLSLKIVKWLDDLSWND